MATTRKSERQVAKTKLGALSIDDAKTKLMKAFASNGFDYMKTALALGCHHYTIRRWARALDMTNMLAAARRNAIDAGKVPNVFGRPKKERPDKKTIERALRARDGSVDETAKALGVSSPTLRTWCEQLAIEIKGAA